MTMAEAIADVRRGCIPGIRGPLYAAIHMADGRTYYPTADMTMVFRVSDGGELVERIPWRDVTGDVECVDWCVDQTGAMYI